MPITQIVRKLSNHLDRRAGELSEARRSGPMDCTTSFEVVAEVRPLSPGSSRAGSMCSQASSSGEGGRPINILQQASTDSQSRPSSSSAALLASSLSGPLPSLPSTSCPKTTSRALRARGKAMLRSEDGLPTTAMATSPAEPNLELNLQHQLSLESSSSMVGASMLHSGNNVSPRYVRSSTAPLPGGFRAARPGSLAAAVSASQQGQHNPSQAAAGSLKGRPSVLHDLESEEEEEDELVHPMSPAAAAAADEGPEHCHWENGVIASWLQEDELVHPMSPAAAAAADEGPEHCHWEDGVIASWLQGIDHSELLHGGEDEEEEATPQPPAAVAGAACSKAAAIQQSSSVPNNVMYSSLLYK